MKRFRKILDCFDFKHDESLAYLSLTNHQYYHKFMRQRLRYCLNLQIQSITFPEFGSGFWKRIFHRYSSENRIKLINQFKYWHFQNIFIEWMECVTNDYYKKIYYQFTRKHLIDKRTQIKISEDGANYEWTEILGNYFNIERCLCKFILTH